MIKFTKLSLTLLVFIFLVASNATALPDFSFVGSYSISDNDSDSFAETIAFDSIFVMPGSGVVSSFNPDDPVFTDPGIEYIELPELILDPASFVSGVRYDFSPVVYEDGFSLYDDNRSMLFNADLMVSSLEINTSTASINPGFSMNLINIAAGSLYTPGESIIVDSFLSASGGATNFTLQLAGDISSAIESGEGTGQGSFSGSASPVPEPAVMLLFGAGFIGLAAYGRNKIVKK